MRYYTYDIETMPNCFTFCGKFTDFDQIYMFEISDRMNERNELSVHLSYLRNLQVEMVGFNNLNFDFPIITELLVNPYTFDHNKAFHMAQTIINGQRNNGSGGFNQIRFSERLIPQIDIVKFSHFDNRAKMTSLKALQFAMRSDSVEDLPYGLRDLNDQEKDKLKAYNIHDVLETEKFFRKNEHVLNMRREYLTNGTLRGDVLNYSDTKIGMEYLMNRLGRTKCFAGRNPRQTSRELIEFSSIILPKIAFRTEPFQEVLSWFKEQRIYISGGKNPKLEVELGSLMFYFGKGGVHASAENKIFKTTKTHQIIDVDATSMYPSIAIANRFAPEHLGQAFVEVYKQIVADRARYPKGTPQNAALKLAANSAYGNSNNPYSFMYDPKFTFSVTVNGQLQLLQLVEMIDLLPDCELIQANTDGVTVRINKKYEYLFKFWCDIWETMTGLKLEEVKYNRMWIQNVNNYISETMDGKLKRKGAYWYPIKEKDYEGVWNKDFSNLASKIAAEKVMTHSWPVKCALKLVTNPFDFMLRYKAVGTSKLFIGDQKQTKTVRYYVAINGQPMKKVSHPKGEIGQYKRANKLDDEYFNKILSEIGRDVWDERIHTKNKSKYAIVTTSVQAGWLVKQCNVASDFNWKDVDWEYYINEANKTIVGSK